MHTFRESDTPGYPYMIQKNGEDTHALFPVTFDGQRGPWYRLETLYGKAARIKKASYWSYNATDDAFHGANSSLQYQEGARIARG